ncbi:MAG: hypothetical protein LBM00_07830 [Deltaproteobacteria bacterium]|jgi:hypothetical protein|nr:hypothetical protein [Deltaproteobacteria bacterium]
MLNKNFTLPEDVREAVISGSLHVLFPEAGRGGSGPDGGDNALKQLEDSGFMYLENIAEELAARLMESEPETALSGEAILAPVTTVQA